MRKEPFLAIIMGLFLGVAVAWGVWTLSNNLSKQNLNRVDKTLTISPSPASVDNAFNLKINQPSDNFISPTAKVAVNGQTTAGSLVIINGPLTDDVLEANADGSFKIEVDLDEGTNEINITAYPPDNLKTNQITETRIVSYTKETF